MQLTDPLTEDRRFHDLWIEYSGPGQIFSQWEMYTESASRLCNEDAWLFDLINHRRFAVFDGATSLDNSSKDGFSGAYWASHIVRDAFKVYGDRDLFLCSAIANVHLRQAMAKQGINLSKKEFLWSTTITAVDLGDDCFSWLNVGDSALVAIYKDGQYEILSGDNDHDLPTRRLLWEMHLKYPEAKAKQMRQLVNDQLIANRKLANVEYGCLNGEEDSMKFIKTGRKSLHNLAHLLLLTDGMFLPNEGFAGIEHPDDFDSLVNLFLKSNCLHDVAKMVRSLERSDPDCHRFLRAKPFDDVTGIAISF